MTFLGLDPATLALMVVAVVAGGFVKGYSGFGASMLWVTSLSLVLPPVEVVPMVLLFEVASSLQLLPAVWRAIDWRSIVVLFAGAMLATPIGVYALAAVPADPIRVAIGVIVLVGCLLIRQGFAWTGRPSRAATLGIGGIFGILNGSTAMGGPPVILFYFATPIGAAASRASIIAFFLATDAAAVALQAAAGVVTTNVLMRTAVFLPLMVLGVWLGARHFIKTEPESFKRFALLLLMGLAVAVLAKAILE
jgi:hypothetical protein